MVRTCLPNHLRVLLRPPAVRAASGHQTDGAVAAADCQAVRRPGLHGQRLRMAAHAAKRPVHLPPPNEITKQARPACHTINTPGSAGTLGHPRDSGMRLLVHVERDWHRHATTVRAVELKVYSLHMTGRSAHLCCLPVETIRQHRHSPAEHRAVHADCQHPQRLCFAGPAGSCTEGRPKRTEKTLRVWPCGRRIGGAGLSPGRPGRAYTSKLPAHASLEMGTRCTCTG